MDWIERWFGLNPDGGDGSVEWLLVGGLVAVGLALLSGTHRGVREALGRILAGLQARARNARR